MDRFAMQCRLGYVNEEDEMGILADQWHEHPVEQMKAVASREEILQLMEAAKKVRMSEELQRYVVQLVAATRTRTDLQLAASPRASLALMKMAQAMSIFEGRDFIVPETIQELAADVVAHRLVLSPDARYSGASGRSIMAEILEKIPVPV